MPQKLVRFFASIADLIRDTPGERHKLEVLKNGLPIASEQWATDLTPQQMTAMEDHYRNLEENRDAVITFAWNRDERDYSRDEGSRS